MERLVFEERLREATERALALARLMVVDKLPDRVLYLIRPNESYDGNGLYEDEEVFPENSLPAGQEHMPPTDATGVIEFFWRSGGKVPDWINISVARADRKHTYMELLCCGRFSAGPCLYHVREGIPPFHILSPTIPRTWPIRVSEETIEKNVAKYGRFKLPRPRRPRWGIFEIFGWKFKSRGK